VLGVQAMFSFLKRKPEIKGEIGFFGLEDWWLNDLSENERQRIQERFKPLGSSSVTLTSGNIVSSGETVVAFLGTLAGWFSKSEDCHIAYKILSKAKTLVNANTQVLDAHFLYQSMIEIFYKNRSSPDGLGNAIDACRLQISVAPLAAAAFRKEYLTPLPSHKGFEQLAIILESQQRFDETIELCDQAKNAGWAGNWDNRIQRCQKRRGHA